MIKKLDKKMLSIKELLELKKQIKNKKPDFIRQDAHKKKRLEKKWRKSKGLHSKIRLKLRGRSRKVSIGYRSPKKVRYLHKSGLKQIFVTSVLDLEKLDAKENCIIMPSTLGNKKKIGIVKKAKEMGFRILNFKNLDDFIKKSEEKIDLKKKEKEEKEKAKASKKVEKKGEKIVKEVKKDTAKDAEKKEKDKLLTKKD